MRLVFRVVVCARVPHGVWGVDATSANLIHAAPLLYVRLRVITTSGIGGEEALAWEIASKDGLVTGERDAGDADGELCRGQDDDAVSSDWAKKLSVRCRVGSRAGMTGRWTY